MLQMNELLLLHNSQLFIVQQFCKYLQLRNNI